MRLRADIWAKGYIRGLAVKGVPAVVVHHGDDDAGAIFIVIDRRDGTGLLFGPGSAGLDDADSERRFVAGFDGRAVPLAEIADRIEKERRFDRDLWLIEAEDERGRHFLEPWLAPQQ